jgi:hypothetical protein
VIDSESSFDQIVEKERETERFEKRKTIQI